MGVKRTKIPPPEEGARRGYAVLKNSIYPECTPEKFLGVKRTKIPPPEEGARRGYAVLKKQHMPGLHPRRNFWE